MKAPNTGSAYAKLWTRVFSSYLLIIFLAFVIYSALVLGESVTAARQLEQQQGELYASTAASLLDDRYQTTNSIALGIDASTGFKDLYYSQFTGNGLDSYENYQLLSELRRLRSSSKRLDIVQIAVFLNGHTKVFTSGELENLSAAYTGEGASVPVSYGSLGELLGLVEADRATFAQEDLVCRVSYTHSGEGSNGCIAVVFDESALLRDIQQVVGSDFGMEVVQNDEVIYTYGSTEGQIFTAALTSDAGVSVRLYLPQQSVLAAVSGRAVLPIYGALVLGIVFLLMAYFFARRNTAPLRKIGDLISPALADTDDIVSGVQNVLGQRDSYREHIDRISPYADQRILCDFLSGSTGTEALKALRIPPAVPDGYYTVAALHVEWPAPNAAAAAEDRPALLQRMQSLMCAEMLSGELCLWGYVQSGQLVMLVVNSAAELDADFFVRLLARLEKEPPIPGCQFTLGISASQRGSEGIPAARRSAVEALNDGILMCGRGEVYTGQNAAPTAQGGYYFPADLVVKISHCIRHNEPERLEQALRTIYDKNVCRPDVDAETLRALVDELHITVAKGVKDARGAAASAALTRPEPGCTLEEIFEHYTEFLRQQTHEYVVQQTDDPAEKVIEEVEYRLYDPALSLKGLAAQFNMSEKNILQIFRKKYGVTFLQYLQRRRIEYACTLLSDTSLTVSEVAAKCGYTNDQSFRRNFIQYASLTPGEYRAQAAQKKQT